MDNARGYGQCNEANSVPRNALVDHYAPQQQVMGYDECQAMPASSNQRGYTINIEPLEYGYLVRVGCKTLAVESRHKLIAKLAEYLENPAEAESKWYKGEFKMD